MPIDLTLLGSIVSVALTTGFAVVGHLYVSLAEERDGHARELRKFEDAIREARATLNAWAPRVVAEPEPLLDVGSYRSNPRPAPVLAERAAAPAPPAWHVAPVASMLREF